MIFQCFNDSSRFLDTPETHIYWCSLLFLSIKRFDCTLLFEVTNPLKTQNSTKPTFWMIKKNADFKTSPDRMPTSFSKTSLLFRRGVFYRRSAPLVPLALPRPKAAFRPRLLVREVLKDEKSEDRVVDVKRVESEGFTMIHSV